MESSAGLQNMRIRKIAVTDLSHEPSLAFTAIDRR